MPRSPISLNGPIAEEAYRPLRGGDLALDFINTIDRTGDDPLPSYDYFAPGYANLLAWSTFAGVIGERDATSLRRVARKEGRQAAAVRRRAVALREAIWSIARGLRHNEIIPGEALATLAAEVEIAQQAQRLVLVDGHLARVFDERPDLDAVLWPVALAAIALFESPRVDHVGECAAEGCGWFFLDTSKNHSRRFCSATGCGNTERVRRFRQRNAATAPATNPV